MSQPHLQTLYFRPSIFDRFPELVAIHSLRDTEQPAAFSMLHGGAENQLAANRTILAEAAGFSPQHLATPRQVHGTTILELPDSYRFAERPEADALITAKPGWLIGVAVADCVAVLLYDPHHRAVAAIHSGWRGSAKNITSIAITALRDHYESAPANLYAFVSPAPTRTEYEVGRTVVSDLFDPKYSTPAPAGKAWFDNQAVVRDQLQAAGIPDDQIEVDRRSTMSDPQFHSARRDGEQSGRMIVAIGLR